jgi:hypothetical protein
VVCRRLLRRRPRFSVSGRSAAACMILSGPKSSNHAMESTASRRTIQLSMSSVRQPAATRALARGGSSFSR